MKRFSEMIYFKLIIFKVIVIFAVINIILMKFLIICITFCFIYLFGCGSDSTTNNGNNGSGETVIFSMDSLSITLSTIFGIIDSNLVINNAPKIKITFDCSTNADSVNSFALFQIKAYDSLNTFKDTLNNKISFLNNEHIFNINGNNFYLLKFYIQINGNTPYYIRLKNIKIFNIP